MLEECPKCNSNDFEIVPTNDIHKIKTICSDCGELIKFGRINEDLTDGQHEFIITIAEEINKTFILFKLENEIATVKKQIWKNEQGKYFGNLKNFIKFFDKLSVSSMLSIAVPLDKLKGKKVIATVENVTRKGKKICEVKSLDKIV
jgi:hypothetical protein